MRKSLTLCLFLSGFLVLSGFLWSGPSYGQPLNPPRSVKRNLSSKIKQKLNVKHKSPGMSPAAKATLHHIPYTEKQAKHLTGPINSGPLGSDVRAPQNN